VNPRI